MLVAGIGRCCVGSWRTGETPSWRLGSGAAARRRPAGRTAVPCSATVECVAGQAVTSPCQGVRQAAERLRVGSEGVDAVFIHWLCIGAIVSDWTVHRGSIWIRGSVPRGWTTILSIKTARTSRFAAAEKSSH